MRRYATIAIALAVACSNPQGQQATTTPDADTTTSHGDGSLADTPGADGPASVGGFPPGTICNASGTPRTRPTTYKHVIMILFENKDYASVMHSANAPYMNSIANQCGYSTAFDDNVFSTDINSLSHYMALTSGSNCNTGVGTSGTGCITDDNPPSSHMLTTVSIMEQVASYRGFIESMPSACGGSGSGEYAPKHNPPPYFTHLSTSCPSDDLAITAVSCPTTVNGMCSAPGSNAFTNALANDTLPAFAFVTPNLINDMHDGSVSQGDNWLHTYLPLIVSSPAYLRGEVALYILWDEQGSFNSGSTPNILVSPYIQPTVSNAQVNLFAALRGAESQLGLAYLGCAGGTPPGGTGSCPSGSTADLRAIFNF
jgi:acid phosphatase